MKKKNLAIYALVGAMAISPIFTSCVDSEETSSVTAIRNAKAEQLKAIADLNNAKAASTAAMAAADAALINAKAEAQKAQKAYDEAQAEWCKTQDEAAKAALEVTMKQAEKDLARIQGEIDKQAIIIQATLLQAKYNLLVAQKNLESATKNYDDYQKAKLQTLAQEYADAVSNLVWYQRELTAEKSKLVKLETGLMEAEEALEAKIAANNNQIALNNIQIETLKQYTNYTEDTDALYIERQEAYSVYQVANNKRDAADGAWIEAMNNVDNEAANEAWEAVCNDEFYQFVMYDRIANEEQEGWYYGVGQVSQYFNNTKYDWENNEHVYGDYTYANYCGDVFTFEYELTKDIRQLELEITDNQIAWRKQNIANLNEDIKTKKTELATAETATATAKKAWDDAAAADKEAKKAEYQAALDAELVLKKAIEDLENSVESTTEWLNVYTKALDMAKNAETLNVALQEKIEAYNEASAAAYAETLAAWEEYMDLYVAAEEAWAEYSALNNLYWGANDVANQIKNLEADNKTLLEEIAEAEKLLTQYDGQNVPYELAIELQKEWIAAKEAIVAAQEVKVEEAKKALDAAMPAEEEEGTEEAPEEGTEEETPAE